MLNTGLVLRSSTPGRPVPDELDPDLELLFGQEAGRRLLCRACRSPITADGYRIDVDGRHVHRRINPAGLEYEFGCFSEAPGAAAVGESTAEHSWFSGYRWHYSICRRCGAFLGWHFAAQYGATQYSAGRAPSFHGLILERLEDEPSRDDPGAV